jgi:hypothetical protein
MGSSTAVDGSIVQVLRSCACRRWAIFEDAVAPWGLRGCFGLTGRRPNSRICDGFFYFSEARKPALATNDKCSGPVGAQWPRRCRPALALEKMQWPRSCTIAFCKDEFSPPGECFRDSGLKEWSANRARNPTIVAIDGSAFRCQLDRPDSILKPHEFGPRHPDDFPFRTKTTQKTCPRRRWRRDDGNSSS